MRTSICRVALLLVSVSACWDGPEVGPPVDDQERNLTEEQLPPEDPEADPEEEGQADSGTVAPNPEEEDTVVRFSELQSSIFTPTCASSFCHKGTPPQTAPMSLEASVAYSQLVDQNAYQVSGLKRVKPGEPDKSYLLLKLRGLAGSVGSSPARMPLNKPALDPKRIAEIKAWIERGAPND